MAKVELREILRGVTPGDREAFQARTSPHGGHDFVASQTLVRRMEDTEWVPFESSQGQAITGHWRVKGPDGTYTIPCYPKQSDR